MQQQMNAARSRLLRGNDEEGVSIDDGTIPLLLAEEEEGAAGAGSSVRVVARPASICSMASSASGCQRQREESRTLVGWLGACASASPARGVLHLRAVLPPAAAPARTATAHYVHSLQLPTGLSILGVAPAGYVDLDLDDAELEDWEGRAAEDQGQPWALVAGAAGGSPAKRGATPDSGVDMWVEAEDVTDILAEQLAAEMQPLMEDVEAAVALAAGRREPAPLDLIPQRVGEEALAAEAALEAAALAAPGSQAVTAVPAAPLTAGEGSHSRARMHRWPGGAGRLEVGGPARRKDAVDDGDE